MRLPGFLDALAHPVIRDESKLRAYVFKVCAVAAALAVCGDIVNQSIFWISFTEKLRSWAITLLLSVGIAYPVSRAIARAHLDLNRIKDDFETLSRTDPLTGLLNRRALFEAATAENTRIIALVIGDIDRFKRVNDTHGHLIGDRVIREIAEALKQELGDLGMVGRIGGEEFALVADKIDKDLLRLRLEQARLRISLSRIKTREAETVRVTISIGAAFAGSDHGLDELYANADRALYAAKAAGGNCVIYDDEVGDVIDDETEMAAG